MVGNIAGGRVAMVTRKKLKRARGRVAMVTRGSSTEKPLHPKRGVTYKHGEFIVNIMYNR